MKRDALNHPKMLDLASTLNCSRAQAIGIMNLLWDSCATFATRGDIGKLRNGAIARGCDWTGDADLFVNALVECGWLERNDEYRLIVHDWPDHCEQWVKLKLQKLKIQFLEVYKSSISIAEPIAEPIAERSVVVSASRDPNPNPNPNPNLDKPSPTTTNNPLPPSSSNWSVRWSVGVVEKGFVELAVEAANRFSRVKHIKLDRELVWRVAWVGVEFDLDAVNDACDRIAERGVKKPPSYLNAMMRVVCEKRGENWDEIKKLVPAVPTPNNHQIVEGAFK